MRLIFLYIIFGISLCICAACSDDNEEPATIDSHLAFLLSNRSAANPYDVEPETAPDEGCVRIKIRGIGGSFGKVFNDSNYRHIRMASEYGIHPFETSEGAWREGKGLVKVVSNEYYYIDSLTHSYAYLCPHAADLLDEIGRRFADSLDSRGGGAYRLKVTSLLRTPMTVGKLRRVNRNAIEGSAHSYGTTFDISHSKFICDNPRATRRPFEDLKNLLAEIIFTLRCEGRCLVKHERKQACFHITAVPDSLAHS